MYAHPTTTKSAKTSSRKANCSLVAHSQSLIFSATVVCIVCRYIHQLEDRETSLKQKLQAAQQQLQVLKSEQSRTLAAGETIAREHSTPVVKVFAPIHLLHLHGNQ